MKYPLLSDEEWLRSKYLEENLSQIDIALLVGCKSKTTVGNALRRFGIPLRTTTRKCYGSKYSELNDKSWLYQKYIVEKLSTNEICELVGAKTSNSVCQALRRFNISIRNVSEGLTINRPDEGFILDREIIDGTLLGDAGLAIWNNESSISNPHYYKKNKHLDHVELVAKSLFPESWDSKICVEYNKNYPDIPYYQIRSYSYSGLKPYYHRWYPQQNNFKKRIPEDVCISPKSLLHWFLDDGSSYRRRKPSKTKQIVLTFSTECFKKENQQMLADKLEREYGLRYHVGRTNSGVGYRMYLAQSQTNLFYEIIGDPVTSLSYKWK